MTQRAMSDALKSITGKKVSDRTVARVSAEEHLAHYRAARALMGNGKGSAKKSAVKNGARGMSDMAGKAAR